LRATEARDLRACANARRSQVALSNAHSREGVALRYPSRTMANVKMPSSSRSSVSLSRKPRTATAAVLALFSLALPSFAATKKAEAAPLQVALRFEKSVLENGLEVIFHEDHRTPVVAVNVRYHVGSKDEAPHRNGFAHLFEHMMFQGSKNVAEDTFFKYLERAGVSARNGTTDLDRTNYFETVPSNQLALVLWLESDRMGFLLDHANEETFASQRDVVKNERRQNYENAPYGLVHQFVSAALYPDGHPYQKLTIGSPEDLDAARLDDVKEFFRRYYVPNNASLVVAGDIDIAAAKALVAKYFGPLARGGDPKVVTTAPEPVAPASALKQERRLDVEADVELARVQMTWHSPKLFAKGDAELDGVAGVLSNGKSSRLYKRLVYELEIAQDVSAHQASNMLASTFTVSATLKKGKKTADAIRVIDEELEKLRARPPSALEVERIRNDILTDLIFPLESVTSRAEQLNRYNQLAHDPGFFEKDIARYENLSPVDIQRAASTYLPKIGRILTLVTPTKGAPRAGRLVRGVQ
jgi:zinc protease